MGERIPSGPGTRLRNQGYPESDDLPSTSHCTSHHHLAQSTRTVQFRLTSEHKCPPRKHPINNDTGNLVTVDPSNSTQSWEGMTGGMRAGYAAHLEFVYNVMHGFVIQEKDPGLVDSHQTLSISGADETKRSSFRHRQCTEDVRYLKHTVATSASFLSSSLQFCFLHEIHWGNL